MSAIFYLKYKDGYLHLHEGMRKVSRVASHQHATPFISEADVWIAARKLKLDSDFVEIVPANAAQS